jgi:hypothetical protein
MLFSYLPFDFAVPTPVDLGKGVYVDRPDGVYELIDADAALVAGLLQHEQIAGGRCYSCLRADIDPEAYALDPDGAALDARMRVFIAWFCMRLALPARSSIAGYVGLDDHGRLFDATPWASTGYLAAIVPVRIYDERALALTRQINLRILELDKRGLSRIRSAVILYAHIEIGRLSSWQLACVGLFATLECLFPQPLRGHVSRLAPRPNNRDEYYGARLGRRIVSFLRGYVSTRGLKRWISARYGSFRNPVAHGYHHAWFDQQLRPENRAVTDRLRMLCRASILGMLGYQNAELRRILPRQAQLLAAQDAIEQLGQARATFLNDFID